MIRLIATDLDGTFLNSDRKVSAENLAAVKECIEAGIIFCLASGRGISTMEPIAQQIGILGPIVSSNGGYVTDLNGEDVYHYSVPAEARKVILDYARDNKVHVNCYNRRTINFSQPGEFADLYSHRTGCIAGFQTLEDMALDEPTKLLYIDHPENIVRHRAALTPLLAPHNISVVVSEVDYVEFLPPGINKGNGLKALCEKLEIGQHEVAAIGDWWNDQEMVEWAAVSGAVANAAPEIKAVAQIHVANNNEHGVAEFISKVLKG